MQSYVMVEKLVPFIPVLFCSDNAFNVLMLKLKSNPISTTREFIKITIIKNIIVPIEPYNKLYRPKLLVNVKKSRVERILRKVAITAPGVRSFHLFVVDGAYL